MDFQQPDNIAIHYEDGFMSVLWQGNQNRPTVRWIKYSATGAYRKALEKMLEIAVTNNSPLCLMDFSGLSILDKDDQLWSREHFIPRLKKAGIRHVAVTMPDTSVGKSSLLKGLTPDPLSGVEFAFFSQREQSEQWLSHIESASIR